VVARGDIFAYPELMSYLISLVGSTPIDDSKLATLTPRELEIAHFIGEGKSNAEIAHLTELAEITVKKHLTSIFHKLGIRDRIGLALLIK
jgi:DNA-binding NarL/FixJ family response regulator